MICHQYTNANMMGNFDEKPGDLGLPTFISQSETQVDHLIVGDFRVHCIYILYNIDNIYDIYIYILYHNIDIITYIYSTV